MRTCRTAPVARFVNISPGETGQLLATTWPDMYIAVVAVNGTTSQPSSVRGSHCDDHLCYKFFVICIVKAEFVMRTGFDPLLSSAREVNLQTASAHDRPLKHKSSHRRCSMKSSLLRPLAGRHGIWKRVKSRGQFTNENDARRDK